MRRGAALVVGDVIAGGPHGALCIEGFELAPLPAETKAWMKLRGLGQARIAYDALGRRQIVVDVFTYRIYPKELS